MKEHLINKEAAEDQNGYSIYANPNKELKQEIIDFVANYAPTEVTLGWPSKTWTIGEKDGNEYKLESGRDVKYVPVAEVEEALADGLSAAINQKFITGKNFHNCFGTLYSYRDGDYARLSIMNITGVMDLTDAEKYPTSMLAGRTFTNDDHNHYQTEFEYELNTYKKLGVEVRATVPGMFLTFTNEGDFRNRNYNENLNYYSNEVIQPSVILDEMKARLRRMIGESKMVKSTKADNYFTDSMLFIPFYYEDRGDHKFGFETIPSRGYADSYQQGSGYTIYKKPAKTVDATVDELIEKLFELVPANVMQFFDLEYVLNYTFEFAKSEEEVEDDY